MNIRGPFVGHQVVLSLRQATRLPSRYDNMMRCAHINDDGKCQGKYKGFTCIKESCRSEDVKKCAWSTEEGFYCMKFNKFECIGIENCGTLNDYMNFIRIRREKNHSS